MLNEDFETVEKHKTADKFEEEEHDYYKLTAPSTGEDEVVLDIYLSEDGNYTSLNIVHRTNIDYEPLFNVLETFYPIKPGDDVFVSDEEKGHRRTRASEDWSTDSLNGFQLYREGPQWDFDVEWFHDAGPDDEEKKTPFKFEITVYDGFGPSVDRASFDPIEKILPVMMRDDSTPEARGSLMRDVMRILGEEPDEDLDSAAANYLEPELVDQYVDQIAGRYDPGRNNRLATSR